MARPNLKVVQPEPAEPTLNDLIDQLEAARIKRRPLDEAAKKAKMEYDLIEEQIKEILLRDNLEGSKTKLASVSLSRNVVGTIKNWDQLNAFVKKTGYFHLFNRSVGAPAFRELYEQEMAKVKPGKTEEITEQRRKEAEEKFVAMTGLAPFLKITVNHSSIKAA